MIILTKIAHCNEKPCDLCGAPGYCYLIPGDLGMVSQVCWDHLEEFLDKWERGSVEIAARMLPKKRTIMAGR